jgi:hypothetical protein
MVNCGHQSEPFPFGVEKNIAARFSGIETSLAGIAFNHILSYGIRSVPVNILSAEEVGIFQSLSDGVRIVEATHEHSGPQEITEEVSDNDDADMTYAIEIFLSKSAYIPKIGIIPLY